MPHRLSYSGQPLDRAALNRQDANWLRERLSSPDIRLLTVWRDRNLITGYSDSPSPDPEPTVISGQAAQDVLEAITHNTAPMFLGLQNGAPVFAVDLSHVEEHEATDLTATAIEEPAAFVDIRAVGGLLSQHHGSIMAFARGLAYWHRRHAFCGACGTATESRHGGHVRTCTNPACSIDHFPRTDPAVIMLVTAEFGGEPHCLLGRQPNWDKGMYSSLAGFVEPGESLEVAVAREVMEEANIEVMDVQYRASQPWPFPSSLMLGFQAKAVTFDVDVGQDELEEALWFPHSEIVELSQANRNDKRLSRKDSIARWLIEDWMNEVSGS